MIIETIFAAVVQLVVSVVWFKYISGIPFDQLWSGLFGEPHNENRQAKGILREDPCY